MCKGRVAVVTGAAGNGMGRSIALTLARQGAAIVVNYRTSQDSAKAIVRHIESQGGTALACQADVASISAMGSALPTSSDAAIQMRRATKRGVSPASSMRAIQ